MVKGDLKEVEEGMLRRIRVNGRIHYCGKNLKIYLFSALKQDRVGPSLQSINTVITSACCCTDYIVELDL